LGDGPRCDIGRGAPATRSRFAGRELNPSSDAGSKKTRRAERRASRGTAGRRRRPRKAIGPAPANCPRRSKAAPSFWSCDRRTEAQRKPAGPSASGRARCGGGSQLWSSHSLMEGGAIRTLRAARGGGTRYSANQNGGEWNRGMGRNQPRKRSCFCVGKEPWCARRGGEGRARPTSPGIWEACVVAGAGRRPAWGFWGKEMVGGKDGRAG